MRELGEQKKPIEVQIEELRKQRENNVEKLAYKLLLVIMRISSSDDDFDREFDNIKKIINELYPPIQV